jgi:hypothetical protein
MGSRNVLSAAIVVVALAYACSSSEGPNGGGPGSSDDGGGGGGPCCSDGGSSGTSGTSGGTSGTSGGTSGTSGSSGTSGGVCGLAAGPIPADRVTTWTPGILKDDQLNLPLGDDGLPTRTDICATLKPGDDIQGALDKCAAGKVVLLGAGTFTVSATITLSTGVVLRGAGSGTGGTTIEKTGGETVLAIGTGRDQTCYGGTSYPLTADAPKEATTVTVGAATSNFKVGQLALVDELDDPVVQQGDCTFFKRVSGRSASQRVEITAVDAAKGTLTLGTPLHWHFQSNAAHAAAITPITAPTVKWAGIESLRIHGGTNSGYDGQMAGGIDISNAAYVWVKDVQTDTIGGMHVSLTGTYRAVVRDSYVHHSSDYGFAHDCYGIVMRCGAADTLVENNIVRYMNKPILFNSTGGGNVVAYNYVDNSWADPPEWQEVNIDCHCSFPHYELIEGNYAPHMGATVTHGNAGYLTFYRNYASSQFAPPAVANSNATQTGNVESFQFQGGVIGMNVLGNVLGTDKVSTTYEAYNNGMGVIYDLADNAKGAGDISATSLLRSGNYDYATHSTKWDPTIPSQTLPSSLYTCKPRWWPAGMAWPWTGPELTPMVGTLPAKDRMDKMK